MTLTTRLHRAVRRRWRRRVALVAGPLALASLVAAPNTATPAHAQAAATCDVDFSASQWNDGNGGFTAAVTITNLGAPISGWTLSFDLPGSAQLTQGWSAVWDQDGQTVTAENLDWNANLGTGGQTTIGFNGSGYAGDPTEFSLNGTVCGDEPDDNVPPSVQITSPQDGQQFTAPANVTVTAEASDPDGQVTSVAFTLNGQPLGEDTTAPYEWDIPNLPAGNHVIAATATDDGSPPATASDDVSIVVTEAGEPAILASPSSLTVPGGGDADFTLVLSEAPTSNVTVSLAATGDPITVTPGTLTFTPANWDQPQTVTVAAPESSESAEITASAAGFAPVTVAVTVTGAPTDNVYIERFLEQYDKIKSSGYFSPQGIPYHSIETLIVEAPDHGHETTSEAFSYWLWLEANYGRVTGDWEPFNQAWQTMETFIIPSSADQPSSGAAGDAQFAAEHLWPDQYPSPLQPEIPVGQDPLRNELASTYGTSDIYGMHWLLDVDNTYGYGRCGDGTTTPSYINTFQRGPQESVWETVPHPSCETKDFGGPNGFLDLFISEGDQDPATQWRYTNAPDADARAVQAAYWAHTWASEQGNENAVSNSIAQAARMGDFLRYSLFDKYFKEVGNCVGPSSCPGGQGRGSAHFLLSWFYAWGGSFPGNEWSWRIGSSASHFGYQNPVAAWALINEPALQPASPAAASDWTASLQRQIEFYLWLQSAEGGIAGGATNSWEGAYAQPPAGTATFYGLFYDEKPVFHDPPSNQWFGFQAWSMQRVAEYYWLTGDPQVEDLLANWVDWAIDNTTVNGADFAIPATLAWEGQPQSYNGEPGGPGPNPDLHVTVTETGQDVGVASALARTLTWWAAASGDDAAKTMAQDLLEALNANADDQGIATVEVREDYGRFDDVFDPNTRQGIFIPDGWSGQMGNGDVVEPGVSFIDIRSFYLDDPDWPQVQAHLDGGPAPEFTYHRFWAQADIATAFADFGFLFPNG